MNVTELRVVGWSVYVEPGVPAGTLLGQFWRSTTTSSSSGTYKLVGVTFLPTLSGRHSIDLPPSQQWTVRIFLQIDGVILY